MNIRTILLAAGLAVMVFACSPEGKKQQMNKMKFDEKAGEQILYGAIDRAGFEKPGMKSWYQKAYANYKINQEVLEAIDPAIARDVRIKIVLGTWCPDSRREVPRFMKIVDYLNIPDKHITMLGVDRGFVAPNFRKGQDGITRVPTFVLTYNGEEIGRIIERPKRSLENDLANILKAAGK